MNNNKLIRTIEMECPLCGKIHKIEERKRISITIIKGKEVKYEEKYYVCSNSDVEEAEFVTGLMENNNLLNARNAYRKDRHLLTSVEIVSIREKYGLSQIDLAKLLGWGEATISRYESKAIQDETHDSMLRIIRDDPLFTLEMLQKNEDKFNDLKRETIKENILLNLSAEGREYLQRKVLKSEYVEYEKPCDENGFKLLDIDKVENVISYLAKRINNLHKVKLMKLLWYSDSLFYKVYQQSMTGLVYCHQEMGALPIGHYKITSLEKVKMKEEFDGEYVKYKFYPYEYFDENSLLENERKVIDIVINKFEDFTTKEIIDYMHDEIAYKKTADKEVIPFSLAKEIKNFNVREMGCVEN